MGGFGRLNKVAYWSMWAVALGRLDGVVVLDVVVNEDGFMQADVPKHSCFLPPALVYSKKALGLAQV